LTDTKVDKENDPACSSEEEINKWLEGKYIYKYWIDPKIDFYNMESDQLTKYV